MTVSPRTLDLPTNLLSSTDTSPLASHASTSKSDYLMCGALFLALLVMYGLLQNPYWVPSGDSEVYIAVARDLVRGRGYQFNGEPVAMVPPGWPWMMAAVMKVSPYFLPLKLLAMFCVIGSLLIAYWIVRRFVSVTTAGIVILSTALLTHVYEATFWLISEGLFCLISAATVLLAMQIREGKKQVWRIVLLAILCGAAVMVRWAGVLGLILVVAILVTGNWRQTILLIVVGVTAAVLMVAGNDLMHFKNAMPITIVGSAIVVVVGSLLLKLWTDRQWIAVLLAIACTGGTFYELRRQLTVTPEQAKAAEAFGGTGEQTTPEDLTQPTLPVATTGPTTAAATAPTTLPTYSMTQAVSQQYEIFTRTTRGKGYDDRFFGLGRWFSWLYWQPFRAAAGSPIIEGAANFFGWIILLLLFVPVLTSFRTANWVWPAVMLYCLALGMNWPSPNARYFVPISFLLTCGVLAAVDQLRANPSMKWVRGWLILAGLSAISSLLFPEWMYLTWRDSAPLTLAALFMAALVYAPRLIERSRSMAPNAVLSPALRTGVVLFMGGTLLCNALLWGVDVWVARSNNFYKKYEAGTNQNLIAASRFLMDHASEMPDGKIVITPAYVNLNRRRSSPFGLRALVLLTGRPVASLPGSKQDLSPGPKLARWLLNKDFQYYVHQTPVSPWRVWHFRVAWWQMLRTGQVPEHEVESGWELWRVYWEDDKHETPRMVPVDLTIEPNWPKRVPGI